MTPAERSRTPVETIDRRDPRSDRRRIAELVEEWEAEIVVIGMPYSLDGGTGPAARGALDEMVTLGDTLSVPVVPYDERLTTVTAERSPHGAGSQRRSPP